MGRPDNIVTVTLNMYFAIVQDINPTDYTTWGRSNVILRSLATCDYKNDINVDMKLFLGVSTDIIIIFESKTSIKLLKYIFAYDLL